jgi:hypothetical protein
LAYVRTGAATGHVEVTFALSNRSPSKCTLVGYPGAELLNAAGVPIATHLRRGGGFFPDTQLPPRPVTLAPGSRALFGISFSDNNAATGGAPCPAAATLVSVPPNAYSPLRIDLTRAGPAPLAPCGGSLVISPVYADTSG